MSKKRNKSVKSKPRRKKSYAQKHPPAKKGLPPVKVEAEDNVSKIVTMIILIIAIVALLVYLIQGGQSGYDWYPNRHRYR